MGSVVPCCLGCRPGPSLVLLLHYLHDEPFGKFLTEQSRAGLDFRCVRGQSDVCFTQPNQRDVWLTQLSQPRNY